MKPIAKRAAGEPIDTCFMHLAQATPEERAALAKALLGLQLRDGNHTRNPFLYALAMLVDSEETNRLCTRRSE